MRTVIMMRMVVLYHAVANLRCILNETETETKIGEDCGDGDGDPAMT
jgi:hypothetical protein